MRKSQNRAFIWSLFLALPLLACSSRFAPPPTPSDGFQPVRAEWTLGDASQSKLRFTRIASDGQSRLLVAYEKFDPATGEKIGNFFKLSTDSGASFGPERTLPHSALMMIQFAFFKGGLAAVYTLARQSNLFYTRSATEGAT